MGWTTQNGSEQAQGSVGKGQGPVFRGIFPVTDAPDALNEIQLSMFDTVWHADRFQGFPPQYMAVYSVTDPYGGEVKKMRRFVHASVVWISRAKCPNRILLVKGLFMGIKNQKDFFSGVMFMGTGVAFAWGASHYRVGDAAQMGPGYFPVLLGVLLTLLGTIITFKALVVEAEDRGRMGAWAWRPLFFIIAANLVFGLMLAGWPSLHLPALGLVPAIFALTFIASLAGNEFRLKEVTLLASVLAAMSYLTFIVLLKLPMPVWPVFTAG